MKFHELSDDEWGLIRSLLSPRAKVGRALEAQLKGSLYD